MTTAVAPNAFEAFLELYAKDSRAFVREVLGATPQPWQEKVLRQYDTGARRLTIRSKSREIQFKRGAAAYLRPADFP